MERFLTEQEPVKEDEDDEALSEGAEEEAAEAAPKRGGGAFGRACALSEPMQAFLGEETMARNQVGGLRRLGIRVFALQLKAVYDWLVHSAHRW